MSRAPRTARSARIAAVAASTVALAITMAGPASATWSVVGTDPATGQVGAAVASCTEVRDLTTTMALVPETGGAVSVGAQGVGTVPVLLASALRSGATPAEAAKAAAAGAQGSATAQYGLAVAGGGVGATTGADTGRTSGARASADGTASIQGNGVASPAVLDATKRGFDTAAGPLAGRLVAALEAGSAAGGDRACGATARSAAVVVLGTESSLFVPAASAKPANTSDLLSATDLTPAQIADQLAQRAVLPAPRGARAPEVYLSTVVPTGGDAVAVIGDRYATIEAAAAQPDAAPVEIVDPAYSEGLTLAALIAFCVVGLIVAALIIAGLRRADRHAIERADDGEPVRRSPFRGEVAQLFDVDIAATIRRNRENERRRQLEKDQDRNRDRVWTGTW